MSALTPRSEAILARLAELRAGDVPAQGGRLLAYVYDSGEAELDELAGRAVALVQPVNGLDPTAFPSVATMEREVIGFVRDAVHGKPGRVVGSVTTGGTESCLLAVKTARDDWRARREARGLDAAAQPKLVIPVTAHAAFQKAAHYFGLRLVLVPTEADGRIPAGSLIAELGDDVALVVVSAPSYPTAALDPIAEVAAAAKDRGIPCHVDACIGGLALPWWPGLPAWDFRVPGVTSLSADLHKFGYAPKGASVLLQRGRDRQRRQFFATTRWPGYPVINPTMLGSKSAAGLAAAWAIVGRLGSAGFAELTASCARSTAALLAEVDRIEGLRVLGNPVGPLFAVVADERVPADRRVDPHHWADRVLELGFQLQHQPGLAQPAGRPRIPHSAHLTVTPVTERVLPELIAALRRGADEVRGRPAASPRLALAAMRALGLLREGRELSSATAWRLLRAVGVGGSELPGAMAPLMALVEALPAPLAERLLTEVIARRAEPSDSPGPGRRAQRTPLAR